MSARTPLRGEVWMVDFAPTRGHEQTGDRPALVVSADDYNRSPSGLVVALPITRTQRNIPWHVPLDRGEGGLAHLSVILCDHVRSVSVERFREYRGDVGLPILEEVERRLRYLLQLS